MNVQQPKEKGPKVPLSDTPGFALAVSFGGIAIAAVLTVLGVRMKNLSFLFIVAWLVMIPAIFFLFKRIRYRWVLSGLCLALSAFVLWEIDVHNPPVEAKTISIEWNAPAPITNTTPLSIAQLNAKAIYAGKSVEEGHFTYTPTFGSTLPVGNNTLSVEFTPNDSVKWLSARKNVVVGVSDAKPDAPVTKTPAPVAVQPAKARPAQGQAPAQQPINYAPGGFAISGGTVTNPTINNNAAPPPAHFTASASYSHEGSQYACIVKIVTDAETRDLSFSVQFDHSIGDDFMISSSSADGAVQIVQRLGASTEYPEPGSRLIFSVVHPAQLPRDGAITVYVHTDTPIKFVSLAKN